MESTVIYNEKKTNTILKNIKLRENDSTVVNPTDVSNIFYLYFTHLPDKHSITKIPNAVNLYKRNKIE